MPKVSVSEEVLDRMISILAKARENIESSAVQLKHAHEISFAEWRDGQYRAIGRQVESSYRNILLIGAELGDARRYAIELKKSVQAYIESGAAAVSPCHAAYSRSTETYQQHDVEDCPGKVLGHPFEKGRKLIYEQGKSSYKLKNTCGLVSAANMARLHGIDAAEEDAVAFAVKTDNCDEKGYVDMLQEQAVVGHYGIDTTLKYGLSADELAGILENGHAVMMEVDSNRFSGVSGMRFFNKYDHLVTVTGVGRHELTGEILGFYICDSSRGWQEDRCRFIDMPTMRRCFLGKNQAVLYSNSIIH